MMTTPVFTPEQCPRYSTRELPAYRHLPFQNLHPFMDKGGHSYGEKLEPLTSFDAENWQQSDAYLYCVDLFNDGFWWEAHERLKYISLGVGRETETGQFVQGIIQVAAALLKHFMDERGAALALAKLGTGNLQTQSGVYLGIAVAPFTAQIDSCVQAADKCYPRIVLQGV